MQQLSSAHQEQVVTNRQYLQIIIECLMFTAQQNIAMRGHEERRKDIWEVSDINRGNFIELLRLRCKDFPWLKSKLQSQLQSHAQWTSPAIQNEILDIVSNMVLAKITADVSQRSGFYGIIVDEHRISVEPSKSPCASGTLLMAKPKRHSLVSTRRTPRREKYCTNL